MKISKFLNSKLQEDMVCLSCTATGERVCLAAEGFGNRHCFLENIADKVSYKHFRISPVLHFYPQFGKLKEYFPSKCN